MGKIYIVFCRVHRDMDLVKNYVGEAFMTAKELIDYLKTVDENAKINIVDRHQNNEYRIVDIQTCEDRSSEKYLKFVDIVIEI